MSWQNATNESPRNAGYWAGYMICKAYYEKVNNNIKAVEDILSIQNYSDFYEKSKVEEYIKDKYGK